MNYNNKKFKVTSNTDNGSTSAETIFLYKQNGDVLLSTYQGGNIVFGQLLGKVDGNGVIDMRYHQIEKDGTIKTGKCVSTPEILDNGRIRLHESWEWTCGDFTKGRSIIEEIVN